MVLQKKNVENMKDFTNLFLSLYSLQNGENEIVEFNKEYKMLIIKVIGQQGNIKFLDVINDKNGIFKIEEFNNYLRHSKILKFFKDDFRYDLENDLIYSEINIDNARLYASKYSMTSIIDVLNIIYEYKLEEEQVILNNKEKALILRK